jgi:elongation factor P
MCYPRPLCGKKGTESFMYSASDLRKGLKILWDGIPYAVTEFQFVKPGKGAGMYKCRLRNMLQGNTLDKTFREVDKFDKPDISNRELHFSYAEGDQYVFVDAETYEEFHVPADVLGDKRFFLDDNMECSILFYNGKPVEVDTPVFVEKEIIETEPGYKGNTATNTMKPAKIASGYTFQVPLFIEVGDLVRIDTRTGEYADRVNTRR